MFYLSGFRKVVVGSRFSAYSTRWASVRRTHARHQMQKFYPVKIKERALIGHCLPQLDAIDGRRHTQLHDQPILDGAFASRALLIPTSWAQHPPGYWIQYARFIPSTGTWRRWTSALAADCMPLQAKTWVDPWVVLVLWPVEGRSAAVRASRRGAVPPAAPTVRIGVTVPYITINSST